MEIVLIAPSLSNIFGFFLLALLIAVFVHVIYKVEDWYYEKFPKQETKTFQSVSEYSDWIEDQEDVLQTHKDELKRLKKEMNK